MHDRSISSSPGIQVDDFGSLADGRTAKAYTIEHPNGLRVRVSDFGATMISCEVPDPSGELVDLVLGFDSVAGYQGAANPYFGASVGRYGNRIAAGHFSLDGKDHLLATNNDPAGIPCHLHGGKLGFSHVLWHAEPAADGRSITFRYHSKDGEEGFPGNLKVAVTYAFSDNGELVWETKATSDAPTVLNLISHSYWNLSGDPSAPITDHQLTLFADRFLPTDRGMIPSGDLAPVAGTPMDFTTPHTIGDRIDDDFEPLRFGAGYDHCWVLSGPRDEDGVALAARLRDPKSGRVLEVLTNQPGIQFYTANWIDEAHFTGDHPPGKGGRIYGKRSACCLETENFPDAPNKPNFPSATLRPGETYRHIMIHRFSAE